MAKLIVPFGEGPTEQAFKAWLADKSIEVSDVIDYELRRNVSDPWPVLHLTMVYREKKEASDG
jgi:hypothetical protein